MFKIEAKHLGFDWKQSHPDIIRHFNSHHFNRVTIDNETCAIDGSMDKDISDARLYSIVNGWSAVYTGGIPKALNYCLWKRALVLRSLRRDFIIRYDLVTSQLSWPLAPDHFKTDYYFKPNMFNEHGWIRNEHGGLSPGQLVEATMVIDHLEFMEQRCLSFVNSWIKDPLQNDGSLIHEYEQLFNLAAVEWNKAETKLIALVEGLISHGVMIKP